MNKKKDAMRQNKQETRRKPEGRIRSSEWSAQEHIKKTFRDNTKQVFRKNFYNKLWIIDRLTKLGREAHVYAKLRRAQNTLGAEHISLTSRYAQKREAIHKNVPQRNAYLQTWFNNAIFFNLLSNSFNTQLRIERARVKRVLQTRPEEAAERTRFARTAKRIQTLQVMPKKDTMRHSKLFRILEANLYKNLYKNHYKLLWITKFLQTLLKNTLQFSQRSGNTINFNIRQVPSFTFNAQMISQYIISELSPTKNLLQIPLYQKSKSRSNLKTMKLLEQESEIQKGDPRKHRTILRWVLKNTIRR